MELFATAGLTVSVDDQGAEFRVTLPRESFPFHTWTVRRCRVQMDAADPERRSVAIDASRPIVLGPLRADDAHALVAAMTAWCEAHPIGETIATTPEELLADPARFNRRRIAAEGPWSRGLEESRFAGAWLTTPENWPRRPTRIETLRVRVVGIWIHGGYRGHMGASRSELVAEKLDTD